MTRWTKPAVIAVLTMALFGCKDADRPADVAIDHKILLVGSGVEPKTLDPQTNFGSAEGKIISALGEGLVTQDPEDAFAVRPGIAERWTHDAELRVWTFHLRSNAKWSDGNPITADDIIFSWRRILTPELGAPLAELYYPVAGAEAFHEGKTSDFAKVGIEAIDLQTVRITGSAPMPYILNMLATYAFFPVPKKAVKANGAVTSRTNNWFEVGRHVSNGPFKLVAWKPNQYIEVRKNQQYWDADNIKLDGIRFFPIENQKSEMNTYLSGRLHITNSVPSEFYESLRGTKPEVVRSDHQPSTSFYVFNMRRGALADDRVRKALSLAIDRKLLVDHVLGGGQVPTGGLVPAGLPDYPAFRSGLADQTKARRLLAEAGYPGGQGFPTYEILINPNELNRKQAEAIQAMWKSALGIEVSIRIEEWQVFASSLQSHDFDIARSSWTGAYPGPGAYLSLITSESANNFGGWVNPRFDTLVKDAQATGSS